MGLSAIISSRKMKSRKYSTPLPKLFYDKNQYNLVGATSSDI